MKSSRLALLLALVAMSIVLSACGASVNQTLDPVAAAATKTQSAGGVKMTMSVTVGVGGTSAAITGDGAFDKGQGSMDLDFGNLLQQAGAPAGSGSTARILYLTENGDPVVYLHLPFLDGNLPGGKSWVRLDLQKTGDALGVNLQKALGSSATQNPSDALQLLQSQGSFTKVGSETIDGVQTTHYQGTIDLQKAAAANGASSSLVQRMIAAGVPTQLPIDVWIDGSGYLRQIKETYGGTAAANSFSTAVTIGLSDYGTTVDVTAPPSGEVFDATGPAVRGIQSQPTTTTPTTTG